MIKTCRKSVSPKPAITAKLFQWFYAPSERLGLTAEVEGDHSSGEIRLGSNPT
jgi:hypothetical protein